jgi:hypothetical protein
LSTDLPFAKKEMKALLSATYANQEEALAAVDSWAAQYQATYPEAAATYATEVEQATELARELLARLVFEEPGVTWRSFPNNGGHGGHKDFPGCFRCHDGKHLSSEGEVVRLECNVCHSVPVISEETQLTTEIELVTGPEPVSHTLTTWIALHGRVKDNSCKACHTIPEGIDDLASLEGKPPVDDSFCGNEACHGNVWTYAGFDAPEMEPLLNEQIEEIIAARPPEPVEPEPGEGDQEPGEAALTYDDTIGPMLVNRCSACHGSAATGGLDVTTYTLLVAGGDSGLGIVAGDLDASIVYARQSEETPHYVQFDPDELQLLADWILAGAPEN